MEPSFVLGLAFGIGGVSAVYMVYDLVTYYVERVGQRKAIAAKVDLRNELEEEGVL